MRGMVESNLQPQGEHPCPFCADLEDRQPSEITITILDEECERPPDSGGGVESERGGL